MVNFNLENVQRYHVVSVVVACRERSHGQSVAEAECDFRHPTGEQYNNL